MAYKVKIDQQPLQDVFKSLKSSTLGLKDHHFNQISNFIYIYTKLSFKLFHIIFILKVF